MRRKKNLIVFFVLFCSLFLGLSNFRIYPFSDFSMFAYARENSIVQFPVIYFENGSRIPLTRSLYFPLTGLNVWQMSRHVIRYPQDVAWLKVIKEKIKVEHPSAASITIQDVEIKFDSALGAWWPDVDGKKVYQTIKL